SIAPSASTASRPAFVTIASRPSVWDGTAGDVLLIWGCEKAEYFYKPDWTTQITLIRLNKSAFWRKLRSAGFYPPAA
ncbi:hypothetical protein, partial [Bradyrhizobium sp.]|uniref:hypothetical protein n=1 Tax=Bradyrhizobium sp. TaxID=376 RepID=UPI003C75AE66